MHNSKLQNHLAYAAILDKALKGTVTSELKEDLTANLTSAHLNRAAAQNRKENYTRSKAGQPTYDEPPLDYNQFVRAPTMTRVAKKLHDTSVLTSLSSNAARPGRPRLRGSRPHDSGGRPSNHGLSPEMQDLVQIAKNPKVRALVIDELRKLGILLYHEKFMILARFYAIIEDPDVMPRILGGEMSSYGNAVVLEEYRRELALMTSSQLHARALHEARQRIKEKRPMEVENYLLAAFFDRRAEAHAL